MAARILNCSEGSTTLRRKCCSSKAFPCLYHNPSLAQDLEIIYILASHEFSEYTFFSSLG